MNNNMLVSGKKEFISSENYEIKDLNKPLKHQHLFEIPPQLKEEMKSKSLALIFYECSLMSLKLNREGNKLTLTFKRESAEQMNEIIKIKVKSYDQVVKNIVLPTIEGVFTIAGLGGGKLEVLSRAWQVAVRSADSQLGNQHQSELTGLDHSLKIQTEFTDQYVRIKQDYSQSFDGIYRTWEQFLQQQQENFRSVAA